MAPRLVERLQEREADPAEIVALAEPYAPDAPLFALALADLPPLEDYFRRLRDVRLEITGTDVAELGLAESPRVGEVLGEGGNHYRVAGPMKSAYAEAGCWGRYSFKELSELSKRLHDGEQLWERHGAK